MMVFNIYQKIRNFRLLFYYQFVMHACKFYVHGIGWGLDGLAVLDGQYGIIGLCLGSIPGFFRNSTWIEIFKN